MEDPEDTNPSSGQTDETTDTTAQTDAPDPSTAEAKLVDQDSATAAPGPDDVTVAADEETDTGLTDEDVELLAEAYRDKLVSSKALKEILSKQVSSEVRRQVESQVRARDSEQESSDLISRGREALQKLAGSQKAAAAALAKAQKGEDFTLDGVLDEKDYGSLMTQWGVHLATAFDGHVDESIQTAWDESFKEMPVLSEEQADALATITSTYERMKTDPRQNQTSRSYFFSELFRFAMARGAERGAEAERNRISKTKAATERIASKNAVAAARAALEKSKNPPPTERTPAPGTTLPSLEAYRAAKKAGDTAKAQEIVDALSRVGRR